MFDDVLPRYKIGTLLPLPVIDNSAYEFYRLAPPGIMLVMIPVGLGTFSRDDVERVFAPLDTYLDMLMERGVDLVMQSGVPLPILIGVEAHDRMIAHMAARTGKPATSSVLGVARAARRLGIRKLALANKWTDEMNRTLGEFLAREGVAVCGVAAEVLSPAEFQRIGTADNMRLAYELGRRAFLENPEADGIYIGGGAWLSQPVVEKLEQEFGKPAISNQSAMIWDTLALLGAWRPIPGHGRLLAMP